MGATFIKICGITRLGDARAAVDSGADALGFVFARSPRRVPVKRAARISSAVPPGVLRFGVFVDADLARITQTVNEAGLDAVQLHGNEPPALAGQLREVFPELFICKAVRIAGRDGFAGVYAWAADAIMVDSKNPAAPGRQSRRIPLSWLEDLEVDKMIVAGGLDPRSVGSVVRRAAPWGVDVSRGVESEPGKKDPALIEAFVRAVRRAETGS
ncbi:MAG: phosphoribosylanthranilate isomerase [Actinomycetota bacterium]